MSSAAQVVVGGAIADSAPTTEPRMGAFPSRGASDASRAHHPRLCRPSKLAEGAWGDV
jgi:hypothetical protein